MASLFWHVPYKQSGNPRRRKTNGVRLGTYSVYVEKYSVRYYTVRFTTTRDWTGDRRARQEAKCDRVEIGGDDGHSKKHADAKVKINYTLYPAHGGDKLMAASH